MQITAHLVKAFTTDKAQGNPAGVILGADSLTEEQMLHIAAELGFSESAFVQASDKADFKVRFFAVTQEVDFCGHATIATFHILMEQGKIALGDKTSATVTQETKAGILPVTCSRDGKLVMTQQNPVFGYIEHDPTSIAKLLHLEPRELHSDTPIQVVSTGTPKLIIPVRTLQTLRKITPDLSGISDYCREHGAKGFYPFTPETLSDAADFYARQFNPLAGINEDPITGIAAGALGCYAQKYNLGAGKSRFIVEQGYDMRMGGEMYVDVTDGVKVGGQAATYGQRDVVL